MQAQGHEVSLLSSPMISPRHEGRLLPDSRNLVEALNSVASRVSSWNALVISLIALPDRRRPTQKRVNERYVENPRTFTYIYVCVCVPHWMMFLFRGPFLDWCLSSLRRGDPIFSSQLPYFLPELLSEVVKHLGFGYGTPNWTGCVRAYLPRTQLNFVNAQITVRSGVQWSYVNH